jgi:hypothetical protein
MISKFPIIQSIIEGSEAGRIFDLGNDTFFCLHDSGFGQVIGANCNTSNVWEQIIQQKTLPKYFHIYDISEAGISEIFRLNPSWNLLIRKRLKWNHGASVALSEIPDGYSMIDGVSVTLEQYESLPKEVLNKFYPSLDLFQKNAYAKILLDKHHEFCSICYAAAWGSGFAEIDVYTNEKYRGMGLAETVVKEFVHEIKGLDGMASWDCFFDNRGSVALAMKCGFSVDYDYRMLSIYLM